MNKRGYAMAMDIAKARAAMNSLQATLEVSGKRAATRELLGLLPPSMNCAEVARLGSSILPMSISLVDVLAARASKVANTG